ncbi:MAG: hypothetical protein WC100_14915 [Sterolibacterium sp.]
MTTQQNDRPVKEFRSRNLKVAIWENQSEQDGQTVVQHSMTFQKRYRERQSGEWKDSGTLFADDALVLAQLLERAFAWIAIRESEPAAAAA